MRGMLVSSSIPVSEARPLSRETVPNREFFLDRLVLSFKRFYFLVDFTDRCATFDSVFQPTTLTFILRKIHVIYDQMRVYVAYNLIEKHCRF